MTNSPSSRLQTLPGNYFSEFTKRADQLRIKGVDIIHLDIGSPDMPPPQPVLEMLSTSAAKVNHHGYQPHRWTPAYREGWANLYKKTYEVSLDPDKNVVPLIGSKEGIFHLLQAMLDSDDIVIVPNPGYITYTRGTQIAGGKIYEKNLTQTNHYQMVFSDIPSAIAQRTKILWLNYPNNPTGATVNQEFFEESIKFGLENDVLICHDAAYTQVAYGDYIPPSILEIPGAIDTAIEFNTLSKSHNMAGWRTAAALGNPTALNALFQLKSHVDSAHFLPIIDAAVTAMQTDQIWIKARNRIYEERRDILLTGLKDIGLEADTPLAGLYVWCSVPENWESEQFAYELLENTGVSVTPGTVFGTNGEGFIRISLTAAVERIKEALDRINDWIIYGNSFLNRR
jgi:LL-diaminopimelate aminotransferase